MKFPLSRIETILLIVNILIILTLFFLPLTRNCWEGYCAPNTPKEKLPFATALLISIYPTSLIIFLITLNRLRKQIISFGGWKNLLVKLMLTIIITGALTGLPILIFWNEPLVFSGPILGPLLGSLISSYLFFRKKFLLYFLFSISSYIPLFLIVWIVIYAVNTISR